MSNRPSTFPMIAALMGALPMLDDTGYYASETYQRILDGATVTLRKEPMGKRARRRLRGKLKAKEQRHD